MEFKKDFFDRESIPDFALKPAKTMSASDPTIYDKLFETLSRQEVINASEAGEVAEVLQADDIVKELEADVVDTTATIATQLAGPVPGGEAMAVGPAEETAANEPDEEAVAVGPAEETAANEPDEEAVAVGPAEEIAANETDEEIVAQASEIGEAIPEYKAVAGPLWKPEIFHSRNKTPKPLEKTEVPTLAEEQRFRNVSYTNFRNLEPIIININEDIIIPDTKPDMVQVLNVDGALRLEERQMSVGAQGVQPIRLAGDLTMQVLYTAENDREEPVIVSLESKVLLKEDATIKATPNSDIALYTLAPSLKCRGINERKFNVSGAIAVNVNEYTKGQLAFFEGLEKEELQLLHSEVEFTDLAIRKSEVAEISEEIALKEGSPEIDKILCYTVNLVENHKQISNEKAMINAMAYINLLYRNENGTALYKCNTDFTQFMKIDETEINHPLLVGKTSFDILKCTLTAKRDEEGYSNILCLNMEVETTIEYYRQQREPCIVDMYHYTKDIECGKSSKELARYCGNGTMDVTVRGIADIPEEYGKAGKAVYITGVPSIKNYKALHDKIVAEGVLPIKLVCIGGESGKLPFAIEKELEFKVALDLPECREDMDISCNVVLRDLEFDQINDKQVALNGEIIISAYAFEKIQQELIQSVSVRERIGDKGPEPAIIVYVAKEGDSLWKVGKKYHASVNNIRDVNQMEDREEVKAGSKILIVNM